jgi:hypothetical protein
MVSEEGKEMDKRIGIKDGGQIHLVGLERQSEYTFTIKEELGQGASCIAYRVSYTQSGSTNHGVLKECWPMDIGDVHRGQDNTLIIENSAKDAFYKKAERFKEGYNTHAEFIATQADKRKAPLIISYSISISSRCRMSAKRTAHITACTICTTEKASKNIWLIRTLNIVHMK